MVAAQDALQGSLEHSLKLSQPTRVFQAVLSYVALVWSEAIVIVAYSGRYTDCARVSAKMPGVS